MNTSSIQKPKKSKRHTNHSRTAAVQRTIKRSLRSMQENQRTVFPGPEYLFDTTRELMICFGWLRLFKTILSPSLRSAQKAS